MSILLSRQDNSELYAIPLAIVQLQDLGLKELHAEELIKQNF